MIPSKKPTAAQIKADKIGKTAYKPVLKDLNDSRPTLEQVETMIDEPMKPRGEKRIFKKCSIRNLERPRTQLYYILYLFYIYLFNCSHSCNIFSYFIVINTIFISMICKSFNK